MGYSLVDPKTNQSIFTFISEFNETWPGQTGIEVTLLIIIMVMAAVGNIMVFIAVYRNKKMQKPTNYFIVNLALADILYAAWIPFIFVTRITQHWVFGHAICKLMTYTQFVCGTCSILTMMAISVERYNYVCSQPGKRITGKISFTLIIITWILSVAFPIPVAIAQSEESAIFHGTKYVYCGLSWPKTFHINVYLACMVVLFFILPLIVISWNYFKIFRTMKTSSLRAGSVRSEKRAEKQVRLAKMFIAIVCVFVIMWLPFFVLSFLAIYLKQITSTQFTVTIILASANTCQNPVIYGYFNTKFRREFKDMCRCCFKISEGGANYTVKELTTSGTTTTY